MQELTKLCVIIFQGRCGSSMLSSMLNEHPNINFEGEILHELLENQWKNYPEGWPSQRQWAEDYLLGNVIPSQQSNIKKEKILIAGYKTKLDSVGNLDEFAQYLQEKQAKVIRLCRENRLEQVLSHLRAEKFAMQTGRWNISHGDSYIAEPIDIDPDRFFYVHQSFLHLEGKIDSFVGKLNLPKLLITYEQLTDQKAKAMHEIYDFLEVDYVNTQSIYKKMSPDIIELSVRNFDQLKKMCKGTLLQRFAE